MRKTKSLYLVVLAILLSPMAANAGLINYDYSGFDLGDGWTSTGTISIDEADVAAGGDLVSAFASWAFTWTNGVDTASLDSSNSFIDTAAVAAFFTADATSVLTSQLCFVGTGNRCSTSGFPVFAIFGNDWVATTSTGYTTNGNTDAPGAWTVPAPSTLVLLGLGFVGMAARRRKEV